MEGAYIYLRRFPAGERCDDCGARRWYQESGFRYCERGHRLEGFIEFDLENEDGFGVLASKSQRTKISEEEKQKRRKRKAKRLGGQEARELYLECIQLVLRKQVRKLIHGHSLDFPGKLEAAVRDLWDLRVRTFPGLVSVDGQGGGAGNEDRVSSMDEGTLFSSQGPDLENNDKVETKVTAVDWSVSPWQLPTLAETLGIIYLACMMLRLPICIGQLSRLAESNMIPYFSVASQLPPNMMESIPRTYTQVFDRTSETWSGDEVHFAVKRLLQGYHKHYNIVFPEPNWPFLQLAFIQQLALPIDIYLVSKRIIYCILGTSFAFNLSGRPPSYAPNPDTMMIASIVVAAKHLYPFEDLEREYLLHQPNLLTRWRLDWDKWLELIPGADDKKPTPLTEHMIYKMTDKELDEYVEKLKPSTQLAAGLPEDLLSLFPVSNGAIAAQIATPGRVDVDEVILQLQKSLRISLVEPEAGQKQLYTRFRNRDYLKGPAKAFHEAACKISGLSMETLLKTVLAVERKMESWAIEKNKQDKDRDQEGLDGEGD